MPDTDKQHVRNRPHIALTVDQQTLAEIKQLMTERRLPSMGVVVDYVFNDRKRLLERDGKEQAA